MLYISNQPWHISRALASQTVALERIDYRILVFFCHTLVREIDLCMQIPKV
jgi:hypothetical protein